MYDLFPFEALILEEYITISVIYPNNGENYQKNGYMSWDFQAPEGFVVSFLLHRFDLRTTGAHLYMGDGVDRFSLSTTSCYSWLRLTANDANRNFTSDSASVMFIFTSNYQDTRSGFYLILNAVPSKMDDMNETGKVCFPLPQFGK